MAIEEYVKKCLGKSNFEILAVIPWGKQRQTSNIANELKEITSTKCCGVFVCTSSAIKILPLPEDYEAVSKAIKQSKRKVEVNMGQVQFNVAGNSLFVGEMQQELREIPRARTGVLLVHRRIKLPTPLRRKYFNYEVPLWYLLFKFAKKKKLDVLVTPCSEIIRRYERYRDGITSTARQTIFKTYQTDRGKVLAKLGLAVIEGRPVSNGSSNPFYERIASKDNAKRAIKKQKKKGMQRRRRLRR